MQSTTPPKEPLRLILVRTIFDTLIERVQKIANMDTKSAAWQQTVSTQVILPDGSWPFLSWNHAQSKLEVDQSKKSVPVKTLMELLQEIRELLCQESSILRTQALKPPTGGGTIAWRMQIGLERDDALRSALQTHILQRVATPTDDDAAAQCEEDPHRHDHSAAAELEGHGSTKHQGEGQGQAQTLFLMDPNLTMDMEAARTGLLQSCMANPAAWCYLNATITGLLWPLLADPPEEAQLSEIWGPQAKAWFLVLEACTSAKPVSLFDLVALQPLMQHWDTQPHQQCCAAEFLLRVLEWSQLPLLDHSWEQRVLQGSQVEMFEKGGEHCLLTVNWIEELDMEHVQLADYIWSWVHHFGMRSAFVNDSPYKCLHLDRGYLVHQDSVAIPKVKYSEVIQLPIFDGDQITYDLKPYQVMAILVRRQKGRPLRGRVEWPERPMDRKE